MIRTTVTLMIAMLAGLGSVVVYADGPAYNYVGIGYVRIDVDGIDDNPTGYGLIGSVELTPDFYLSGDYSSASADVFGISVDVSQYDFAVGYKYSMQENTDLTFEVGYAHAKAESGGIGISDSGYSLGVGVRSMLSDAFEAGAGVDYVDLGDMGDDTSFEIYGTYTVANNVDVGATFSTGSDSNMFTLGVRFTFDK
jgi:hypothetical protein